MPTGVPSAGYLQVNGFNDGCAVTVVSEFLAITARHCPIVDATLILNVSTLSEPGHVNAVKGFTSHPTLDVQATFLRDRTGLTVTPPQEKVAQDVFHAWGYGVDTKTISPDT